MPLPTDPAALSLMQQYGMPTPPTEEQLTGLQDVRKESLLAEALRGRAVKDEAAAEDIRSKQTGSRHWLGSLIDVGNVAAGNRKREIAKREGKGAEATLANSLAAVQGAEDQRLARTEQQVLGQSLLADRRAQEEAAAAAEEARLNRGIEREKMRSAESIARNKPGKQTSLDRPTLQYTIDGDPVKVSWDGYNRVFDDGAGNTYTTDQILEEGSLKLNDKKAEALINLPSQIERVNAYTDYSDEQWEKIAQPVGIGTKTFNEALGKVMTSGVLGDIEQVTGWKVLSPERQDAIRESVKWYADFGLNFKQMTREMATSGVLSDQDVKEFEKNINVSPGMDAKALRNSVESLIGDVNKRAQRRYSAYVKQGEPKLRQATEESLSRFYGDKKDDGKEEIDTSDDAAYEMPPPEEISAAEEILANPGAATPALVEQAEKIMAAAKGAGGG